MPEEACFRGRSIADCGLRIADCRIGIRNPQSEIRNLKLCRYVSLVRISRCSFFSDQSASCMNQSASQSSSSGCVGRAPIWPKSLGVATSPSPKWCCQTRLTITRAVSGLSALAIQRASVSRRSVD